MLPTRWNGGEYKITLLRCVESGEVFRAQALDFFNGVYGSDCTARWNSFERAEKIDEPDEFRTETFRGHIRTRSRMMSAVLSFNPSLSSDSFPEHLFISQFLSSPLLSCDLQHYLSSLFLL